MAPCFRDPLLRSIIRKFRKKQPLVLLCLLLISFSSAAQFIPKGDASQISTTCYRITPDVSSRFGTIWWKDKIDLTKPFEVSFIIFLGSKDIDGADGIAFVFHNDPRGMEARGSSGSGLGFGYDEFNPNAGNAISPSVAIEFDTFDNTTISSGVPVTGDIPQDHTTVVYNGLVSTPKLAPVFIDPDKPNVEDNKCHTYKITWNPATQELQLFFDGKRRFNHQDDLVSNVFGGAKEVYYGFTGSTGGLQNEQTICIIDPASKPEARNDQGQAQPLKPITLPVMQNDLHTKNEPIRVTRVVTGPQHGTTTIFENQVIYTANRGFTGADTFVYEVCESASDQCYSKCATATVTMQVSCPPMATPTLQANEALTICAGSKIQLTASQGENYMYQWRRNGQPIGGAVSVNTLEVQEAGQYSADVINACGALLTTNNLTVTLKELPLAPKVTGATICGPGSLTLQAVSSTNVEAFRWYDAPTATVPMVLSTTGTFKTPHLTKSTTFYVSVVQNGCEGPKAPVEAIIQPLPLVQAGPDVTINLGQSTELQASGGVSYSWQPTVGLSNPSGPVTKAQPQETTTYTVIAQDAQGCENQASVTVTVTKNVVIPTAFSPNGDGTNETWEITNIFIYPNATLRVFDRWGGNVYEAKGYRNDWNGTQKGKPLPVGTYFYHLNLDQGRTLTGSVSIVR
ncbi:lectin-like domain-containing protein [Rufibacter roseolus]|uniref:lectin-like domain-containing protein n=1 Tax=Rufibacter roseolus TaxID=2817375 RepID=UPI001B3076E6|nr:gliding motility-associated C-terminal domain-containing protein [Rufibacter roseolus]